MAIWWELFRSKYLFINFKYLLVINQSLGYTTDIGNENCRCGCHFLSTIFRENGGGAMIEAVLLEIIYLLLFALIVETIIVFALIILVIILSK